MASAFPNLNDLWDAKKQWNNDAGRHEWDINLPVYQEGGSCSNPSGSITIVGYAKAVMVNVKKNIQVEVKCDGFLDGMPDPNRMEEVLEHCNPYRCIRDWCGNGQ